MFEVDTQKVIPVMVGELQPGPYQPDGRTNNTTDIQQWMQSQGAETLATWPLLISSDGEILDGHRRWTAARALGWKQVHVRVVTENAKSLEGLRYAVSSTLHLDDTPTQQLWRLQVAERELGLSFEQTVKELSYPMGKAQRLTVLSRMPKEIQNAVDRYYCTDGKEGMSLSAMAVLAKQPEAVRREVTRRTSRGDGLTRTDIEHIAEQDHGQVVTSETQRATTQNLARRALAAVIELNDPTIALGLTDLCQAVLELAKGE